MARFQGHPDPATEPATAEGTDASSGEGATGSPSTAGMPGMEATTESMSERYQDLSILGSGGFGEVRRVYDRKLGRTLAMKLLFPDLGRAEQMRARFLTEIAITARLQHPGIVAVHDAGALEDGRLWFTMPEVHGRTLAQVIDESFASAAGGPAAPPGVIRRRLLDIFARVCETAAYVHSRGVIHRDLKPSNIMVGEFGEVLLMDWGIARRLDAGDPDHVATHGPAHGPAEPLMAEQSLTQHGDVLGTPAYMAPEQARGEVEQHGPASDVYSLGAILYHLLSGRPPFVARSSKAWRRVAGNPPPPLRDAVPPGFDVPAELEAICERALARDPGARYADAGELGAEISAWLAGARRRERALARLQEVAQRAPRIAALRARAEALRIEARRLLADVHPFEPIEAKLPGWEHEDRAQRLDQEAALQETHWQQGIHGVLAIDPDLPDAHDALADHYRAKLAAAERARQPTEAARYEVLLRAHDRGRHTAFLGGRGTLTLVTEPAGAIARLYRYVTHQRRLIPELARELGPTPLVDVPLERGSYLVRLSAPGRIDVSYPVLIERGRHWDGRPPGSAEPYAIPLPRVDEIGAGEVYVPAGWAYTGGDPDAPDGLAETRVWIDGFVIGRFPVTNREYVQFLDDLAARGRHEEAMAACPRANRGTTAQADQELAYGRDAAGRFYLDHSAPGRMGRPDHPAVLMSWHGAMAYARWLAERTGHPYRLPNELEREKAARGVDGRLYPWGDHGDPAWACMLQSHRGDTGHVAVDSYPVDDSPYGMRGGAGNSRDWCINVWTLEGPDCSSGRLIVDVGADQAAPPDAYRSVRGGAWTSVASHCRTAARFAARPDQRRSSTGLRIVRAYLRAG